MNEPARTAHRADIDGLRAVAVVAVLLFHADFARFSGGYVGVDVFFVISGFLITQIVLRELAEGTFSMRRFYERRVRRIFPALVATLVLAMVVGAFLLVPYRLEQLGNSVVAVSVFLSNVLFWKSSGYFGATADQLPLLHTWSLAVEEQFYLAYPLFLLAIHRVLAGRFRLWIGVTACVSFLFGVWFTRVDPSGAFYLAPSRAWQLLCGALVACNALPPTRDVRLREGEALAGLVAILASVFFYTPETPFPGVAALVPTLGAALVIHADMAGPTLVARVLGARPVTFVGAISYSLYLVHWPVFVYAKQYAIIALTPVRSVELLALSFALAVLSWRFVELPFRAGATATIRNPVQIALAGVSIALTAGVALRVSHGLPGRSPALAVHDDPAQAAEWTRWRHCSRRMLRDDRQPCAMGREEAPPSFVVWGDSHSRAVAIGVNASAETHGQAGFLANADGCPPLLGLEREGQPWCVAFNSAVLKFIASHPELHTVVLSARWAGYVNGRLPMEPGGGMSLRDAGQSAASPSDRAAAFSVGLSRTVHRLLELHREIYIVDEVPEVGYDVPTAYSVAQLTGRDVSRLIAPTRTAYELRTRAIEPAFRAVDTLPGVHRISVASSLCDRSTCRIVEAGRPLYLDGHHLSSFGARRLTPLFDSLFATSRDPRIY